MDRAELDSRLSRIATHWTVVRDAHADAAGDARGRLLLRYRTPVYRYLLGATRDPDAAEELCQEFAVRFLRGDFRRADPERGRFRDYVKRALVNLVNDHHRTRAARPATLPADAPQPVDTAAEDTFNDDWRHDLLEQTWAALAEQHPAYHAVLLLRVENPDIPSAEMAAKAGERLGKPMTPEYARKALQRGHAKFAELLLDQVAASLDGAGAAELEAELRDLDLLKYCRTALAARTG
jgi:RNA polymerase sigma-70 factor (ECF subfamily)